MQWDEPTEEYKKLHRTFVRTPVVWDAIKGEVNNKATYDDPEELFPDAYVEYTQTVYGREKDFDKSMII